MDYVWDRQVWTNSFPGDNEWEDFWFGTISTRRQDKDTTMEEGHTYHSSHATSPRILHTSPMGTTQEFQTEYGGPFYVEVGRN